MQEVTSYLSEGLYSEYSVVKINLKRVYSILKLEEVIQLSILIVSKDVKIVQKNSLDFIL